MDLFECLIDIYENNEELTIEEVFSEGLKKNTNNDLNKEAIVELKRRFMCYVKSAKEDSLFANRSDLELGVLGNILPNAVMLSSTITEKEARRCKSLKNRKRYVEAFVSNISAPTSLAEMYSFFLEGNDAQQLINDINTSGHTFWTVPRWAKRDDIVFFMHSKTSNSTLTRLRTRVRTELLPESKQAQVLEQAIAEQLAFHRIYGGKIYAIGRVNGKPEDSVPNPLSHSKTRTACDIDDLYLLKRPIDISEFNSFITISRQGSFTPVYGVPFERLKDLIRKNNDTPEYFNNSVSTPYPHSEVNAENWMNLGLEYRNRFTLEIQFRQCYVDYLLKELGDQKTIYIECACYKGKGNKPSFVDNVFRIDRKLLPVEIKLNIRLETGLEKQCEQYCKLDQMFLDRRAKREAKKQDIINDMVLIIDTYAVYMFDFNKRSIKFLYDLDDLQSKEDIRDLRKVIISCFGR